MYITKKIQYCWHSQTPWLHAAAVLTELNDGMEPHMCSTEMQCTSLIISCGAFHYCSICLLMFATATTKFSDKINNNITFGKIMITDFENAKIFMQCIHIAATADFKTIFSFAPNCITAWIISLMHACSILYQWRAWRNPQMHWGVLLSAFDSVRFYCVQWLISSLKDIMVCSECNIIILPSWWLHENIPWKKGWLQLQSYNFPY